MGTKELDVDVSGLKRIGARAPIIPYITALWGRRYFIWKESRSHAFGQIKNTVLGQVWLILDPFLNAAVYYVIFGMLLNFRGSIENFVGYLVIGTTCFALLNNQLQQGAGLIASRRALMKSFSFPRAALVFSFSIQKLIDFTPTIFASMLFIIVVAPHSLPYWTWLLTPVAIAIAIPFGLGLAFISSTITARFPDFKFIWPVVGKFWTYGSAIFWSIEMFNVDSLARPIMHANPGWEFLEIMRQLLVYNSLPPTWIWGAFTAWSFGIFLFGFFIFWMNEEKFGVDK